MSPEVLEAKIAMRIALLRLRAAELAANISRDAIKAGASSSNALWYPQSLRQLGRLLDRAHWPNVRSQGDCVAKLSLRRWANRDSVR